MQSNQTWQPKDTSGANVMTPDTMADEQMSSESLEQSNHFKMDLRSLRVIFTKHALQRVEECQLSIGQAIYHFKHSNLERLDRKMSAYKKVRYHGNEGVRYYRNGTFIFIAREGVDKRTGKPAALIITMSDQRITSKV